MYNVIYEFRICNDITNIDWQKFNYPFLQLFQKTNIDNDIFISFVFKWQWQLTIQMMDFICMFIFGRFCTKSWFARHIYISCNQWLPNFLRYAHATKDILILFTYVEQLQSSWGSVCNKSINREVTLGDDMW